VTHGRAHVQSCRHFHCEGCESAIEAGLRRLDGVRQVRADHRTQTVKVRFDEARLGEADLAGRLAAIGYEPVGS
jgi:copper chaperone CopZ